MNREYLYRYDTSISDIYDGPRRFNIKCKEYEIINKTEKGCWILTNVAGGYYLRVGKEIPKSYKKFVLEWNKSARKRWAYPTKELAYKSFKIRKFRQLEYLENQIRNCKFVNKMIDEDATQADMAITRFDYV